METITNNNPVKIKDPKRVEAGKRLAAISKEAKEKKKVQQCKAEQSVCVEEQSRLNFGYVIGTVGAITGIVALYFAYKQSIVTVPEDVVEPQKS